MTAFVRNPTSMSESLMDIRTQGVQLSQFARGSIPEALPAIHALMNAPKAIAMDGHAPDMTALLRELPDNPASQTLASDILLLSECFCDVADTNHARVRLERVEDDGCALFHADTLRIRLLCTYVGPGTEWLEPDNVRPHELGLNGRSVPEANAAIVIDVAKIRRVPAWHVVMFTGRMRTDTPPLVHRSAPVRTAAENRLRLCIDLPDACGC